MPDFWYSALTSSGKVEEGVIAASDEDGVERKLRETGAYLIRAEARGATVRKVRKVTDGKVERREQLAFLEYVAGSLEVGIPILDTLSDVAKRLSSKRLRVIVEE